MMSENNFKQLGEGASMIVAMHWDLFQKYMTVSDGDVKLSISLADTALHEMLHINDSVNDNDGGNGYSAI